MSVCAHAPPSTLLELSQHTNKVVENLQVLVCGGLPHGLDQNQTKTKRIFSDTLIDFSRQIKFNIASPCLNSVLTLSITSDS